MGGAFIINWIYNTLAFQFTVINCQNGKSIKVFYTSERLKNQHIECLSLIVKMIKVFYTIRLLSHNIQKEGKIIFRLFCCSSMRQNSVIEHNFGNDKHSVLMLNTSIPKNVSDMHLLRCSFSFFFSLQPVSLSKALFF